MRNLLTRENTEVLAQYCYSRVLLAFDFDGTLAPIVANRHAAFMRAHTSALFKAVCERYPCAIISGRAKADVAERLDGAPVKYVVGNHGLEPGADLSVFEGEIQSSLPLLMDALQDVQGIDIEDKRYSLALHYRRSRQKRAARNAILRAIAALPVEMRVVLGKLVINMVPARAANKGDALMQLRQQEDADTVIYVGDDETDEDVFKLDQPGRLLTIRIGESQSSAAAYHLRDQRDIDRLLTKLVALRTSEPKTDSAPP